RMPNEERIKELGDIENLTEEYLIENFRPQALRKCINCVHPGFVNTDITWHTGTMHVEEGDEGPVMLALLPDGGPTGCYFDRTVLAEF
ncbi:hypothetical protein MTR67_048787, partial [Solanum verrucosum]